MLDVVLCTSVLYEWFPCEAVSLFLFIMGWVGSVRWWVVFGRVTENGPTANSDIYTFTYL